MYQRDLILDEVKKLARILAKLMGLKSEDKQDEFAQLSNKTLSEEYGVSFEELTDLSLENFKAELLNKNYSANKLDYMAQFLYLTNEPFAMDQETVSSLQKIIAIFDLLEQRYHYQSFENINKRNAIYQFLKLNNES